MIGDGFRSVGVMSALETVENRRRVHGDPECPQSGGRGETDGLGRVFGHQNRQEGLLMGRKGKVKSADETPDARHFSVGHL